MICPACGFENIQGDDECANCGADLRTADIPAPSRGFEERLVAEHLADLRPPPAPAIAPTTSAAEAVHLMQQSSGSCLLVEQDGRLLGIVTDRDLAIKLTDRPADGVTVEQLMTADPVVLRGDDSVAVAIHKMAVGGFRHIPLVEDGRATGVISATDLFRYILRILG
jgi:CBS domain-containing protein